MAVRTHVSYVVDGIEGIIQMVDEQIKAEKPNLDARTLKEQDKAKAATEALEDLRAKLTQTTINASIAAGPEAEREEA